MWQVFAAATNLPPDAVQSHEHTLHTYRWLPDIIRKRERERGSAMHSGRRTECVRKNKSIGKEGQKKKGCLRERERGEGG